LFCFPYCVELSFCPGNIAAFLAFFSATIVEVKEAMDSLQKSTIDGYSGLIVDQIY
jgi:hypothetical protein